MMMLNFLKTCLVQDLIEFLEQHDDYPSSESGISLSSPLLKQFPLMIIGSSYNQEKKSTIGSIMKSLLERNQSAFIYGRSQIYHQAQKSQTCNYQLISMYDIEQYFIAGGYSEFEFLQHHQKEEKKSLEKNENLNHYIHFPIDKLVVKYNIRSSVQVSSKETTLSLCHKMSYGPGQISVQDSPQDLPILISHRQIFQYLEKLHVLNEDSKGRGGVAKLTVKDILMHLPTMVSDNVDIRTLSVSVNESCKVAMLKMFQHHLPCILVLDERHDQLVDVLDTTGFGYLFVNDGCGDYDDGNHVGKQKQEEGIQECKSKSTTEDYLLHQPLYLFLAYLGKKREEFKKQRQYKEQEPHKTIQKEILGEGEFHFHSCHLHTTLKECFHKLDLSHWNADQDSYLVVVNEDNQKPLGILQLNHLMTYLLN